MSVIYLDHNATSPLAPEVAAAMHEVYAQPLGNPSSAHRLGRRARRLLEDAREGIAALLGVRLDPPQGDRLIFTSGGTEANNLALTGLAPGGGLIVSSIEHPSVRNLATQLARQGLPVRFAPAQSDGRVDVEALFALVDSQTRVIGLMLANNETGVIQPLAEVVDRATRQGLLVFTDACQAVGKLEVDFTGLGVAGMSVAAHKFQGPVGIGALIVRGGLPLQPQLSGGAQELGMRPGTEAVALAVGFHTALELWHRQRTERFQQMTALRDRLEQRLLAAWPELVVHGRDVGRLPHTSNIAFPGVDRQAMLLALDQAGVACSAGSACASGSSEPSPTLLAMGCDETLVRGSLRFSVGATTTPAEVDLAVNRILNAYKHLRHGNLAANSAVSTRDSAANPI